MSQFIGHQVRQVTESTHYLPLVGGEGWRGVALVIQHLRKLVRGENAVDLATQPPAHRETEERERGGGDIGLCTKNHSTCMF